MDQVLDYALSPEIKKEAKPTQRRRKKEKEETPEDQVQNTEVDIPQPAATISELPALRQDYPGLRILLD
jgi:hypothetical protein